MKKVILMAVVATFLMSSCHKESSFTKCEGKYEVKLKNGKCFYNKGVTSFGYKQIPRENCKC